MADIKALIEVLTNKSNFEVDYIVITKDGNIVCMDVDMNNQQLIELMSLVDSSYKGIEPAYERSTYLVRFSGGHLGAKAVVKAMSPEQAYANLCKYIESRNEVPPYFKECHFTKIETESTVLYYDDGDY